MLLHHKLVSLAATWLVVASISFLLEVGVKSKWDFRIKIWVDQQLLPFDICCDLCQCHLLTKQPRDLLGSELTVHYSRRSNNLHDWENLWEDDACFSQVFVQNSLVKVIGGIFDLGGLENHSGSMLPNTAGNKNHRIQSQTICHLSWFTDLKPISSPAQWAAEPGSLGQSAPPHPAERWTQILKLCEGESFRFFESL